MKRKLWIVCAALFCTVTATTAFAQKAGTTYNTGIGLGIDFGDGGTFAGPTVKHFFNRNNAGKAEVLFGSNTTMLSLYYQYHGNIPNASGLNWTLGLGGSAFFYSGGGDGSFAFRPTAGLDYKLPNIPFSLELDWRPAIFVTDGSDFNGGRFGFGFRYSF